MSSCWSEVETWEGGEGVWLAWCGLYCMWVGHTLPCVGGGVSFMLSLPSPYHPRMPPTVHEHKKRSRGYVSSVNLLLCIYRNVLEYTYHKFCRH